VEKLLISRTDLLVGANAAALLADRMDVIGAPTVRDGGPQTSANAAAELLVEAVHRERPNCVLHAGPTAWSGWDVVGTDGVRVSAKFDVQAEADLLVRTAAACRETGARLIVVATDAVFCGPRMFHEEAGCSWSATAYARAARQIEQILRETDALVLRGHVYGWMPAGGATNYAERMFHSLTAELPHRVDVRRNASPITATDFVQLLYAAYREGLSGLFNLSGAERTTPHRFAAELAVALGVPGCNVRLEPQTGPDRKSYLDETSLNVGALRKRLNRPLPMLREGLARFADQAFNGYRERLAGPTAAIAEAAVPQAA
jgi:dTDP-4-dehydrorhamnose reductase